MHTPTAPIITTLTRVLGSVQATLGALAAVTVLTDLHESIPVILGVAVGVVGAVQIGLHRYAADETTASSAVAEYRDGGDILAGPANDLVTTGHHVRTVGVDQDHPDPPYMVG